MKIIELKGTDYEMGFELGKRFRAFLSKRAETEKENISLNKKKIALIQKKLKKEYPSIYQEIKGRADGAEITEEAMVYLLSPELSWKEDGCTTVIMKDQDGDILFSHNEDESAFTASNTAFVKYVYPDHSVMGYLAADKLLGSCFGFNSHGLLFSSNFIASYDTHKEEISRYVLQRYLMDATSLSDLEKRMRQVQVASPFSMNVMDVKKKKAVNIEKDFDRLYITKVSDRYARSNHFLGKKGDVKKSENSAFRHREAERLIKKLDPEKVSLKDLQKILHKKGKDDTHTIFLDPKKKGRSKTVSNLSFSTKDHTVIISDFLSKKIYRFSFEEE